MLKSRHAHRLGCFVSLLAMLLAEPLQAEDDLFEQPPVSYSATAPHDAVARLEERLASGAVKFTGDDRDILRQLLKALEVPEASQMVVFSKTSFQIALIHPGIPAPSIFPTPVTWAGCRAA